MLDNYVRESSRLPSDSTFEKKELRPKLIFGRALLFLKRETCRYCSFSFVYPLHFQRLLEDLFLFFRSPRPISVPRERETVARVQCLCFMSCAGSQSASSRKHRQRSKACLLWKAFFFLSVLTLGYVSIFVFTK